MFKTVFIEKDCLEDFYAKNILKKIKYQEVKTIDSIDELWGRVKKPYLQKRTTPNLFIGQKKGTLVKEAPPAYGHGQEKHFYFIHAYNCIYECQYCYLQGYFDTPDMVFFINHSEILNDIKSLIQEYPNAWFHAGEYSDSLALSHITGELSLYFDFFKLYPKAKLELRSKSVNVAELIQLTPHQNIIISFTLSSKQGAKEFDLKCPSVKARIAAITKLVACGYQIGVHFDPIIYHENFEVDYLEVMQTLGKALPDKQLSYISLGVVRFTKDVYREVLKNYPDSRISKFDYIKSFDGKVRYNKPMRMWMMNTVKKLLLDQGYQSDKIYYCMED
jgi:spore photoproduct lyase